jgi:diguanylate cyclase
MSVLHPLNRLHARWRAMPRVRIMAWALLVASICGATGLLRPVDDLLRSVRYQVREVPADGSIVVVAIDQKSLDAMNTRWPWPRRHYATLIDNLKKAGVNRIVFDKALADPDTPEDDRALIDVLKKYKGDVYLGVGFGRRVEGRFTGLVKPHAAIRPHAKLASMQVRLNTLNQLDRIPTVTFDGTDSYPSIALVLSGSQAKSRAWFRPDFSIRASSFPTVSASDLLGPARVGIALAGKDVIVGDNAPILGDIKHLVGQGAAPGAYAHAIGAQTLKSGTPVQLGWLPYLLLIAVAGAATMVAQSKRRRIATFAFCFFALLVLPGIADSNLISLDVAPAVLLMLIVMVQDARRRLGQLKSRTNNLSGLGNIAAFRELDTAKAGAVIAAKIENYSAIVASFPADVEHNIVAEIVKRLRVGDEASSVHQADDGVFYWIAPIHDEDQLSGHVTALRRFFANPLVIGDRTIDLSITIGADLDGSRSIASRAGSALLTAEAALEQGQHWKIYDPQTASDAAWRLSIASEIDRSLARQDFWLAFQPKMDLRSNTVVGAEILLRWDHPARGNVTPSEFIPAAERSERIVPLTHYVFERAVKAASELPSNSHLKLAVNVSTPVLRSEGFVDRIDALCKSRGVDPSRIVLEITESMLISADDELVAQAFTDLRASGFCLSVDDFGTGYASLDYINRVPAQEMKVDQSFVRRMLESDSDRIVVESVIQLAHQLGRKAVAEGVEDFDVLQALRDLGCDEVQGYLIGKPVSFARFMEQLGLERRKAA